MQRLKERLAKIRRELGKLNLGKWLARQRRERRDRNRLKQEKLESIQARDRAEREFRRLTSEERDSPVGERLAERISNLDERIANIRVLQGEAGDEVRAVEDEVRSRRERDEGLHKAIEKVLAKIKRRRRSQDSSPSPKPEHGNGHEWGNLTDRAKKLLAIAVESYGLACTSITRSWGTGSHHESVPTHGFDCAGSRMTEFQRDLRYGRIEGYALGSILELYGPDNVACADNGVGVLMPEGSANEELHDNHVHAFLY